mmetsp:Transcript_18532/g.55349  ORF Transcript_18532/g.55349 Transcript_18532/m.55349 type:complete len:228 (-) Transcript_18532:131-814(-)
MLALRGAVRAASRRGLDACGARAAAGAWARPPAARCFGGAASKVVNTLQAELKHEQEQYTKPDVPKAVLDKFKLVEKDGDVNMMLEREMGGKMIRIEWQIKSPFDPDEDMEGGEAESAPTDFSVTVEDKSGGAGICFYCSTQTGEDHRYVLGNVKSFANAEEKDSISGYNGPDFEDIDDKLQEAFDEYLAELGMNNDVCDFVDAMAEDKEQREYIRWLKLSKEFLES